MGRKLPSDLRLSFSNERAFMPTQEKKILRNHGIFAAGRVIKPTQEKKNILRN